VREIGSFGGMRTATAGPATGAATAGRLGLRIWHVDARTGLDVVDYDNRVAPAAAAGAAAGRGSEGSAVAGGAIVIRE
jgi:hypothetical protein